MKLPLILGIVLALAGSGGAFYAARAGLLPWDLAAKRQPPPGVGTLDGNAAAADRMARDVAFVPVPTLVISLGDASARRHLRFRAQLDVPLDDAAAVERAMPRVVDVLNGYLRALSVKELEQRTALMRLRTQMLRRVQIVTGPKAVNDLLIMEFVLN